MSFTPFKTFILIFLSPIEAGFLVPDAGVISVILFSGFGFKVFRNEHKILRCRGFLAPRPRQYKKHPQTFKCPLKHPIVSDHLCFIKAVILLFFVRFIGL